MKRIWSGLKATAGVVLVCLVIDFIVTLFIPVAVLDRWLVARDRNALAYDNTVPWHHDLARNFSEERLWGRIRFPFKTDEYGLRTGKCADDKAQSGKTIFVVGDSVIEGLGVLFEDTVAGRMACAAQPLGLSVRSLGVAGHTPLVYARKIASVVERMGVKPREIVLFLDVCDIWEEVYQYKEVNGRLENQKEPLRTQITDWLRHNFSTVAVAAELRQRYIVDLAKPVDVLNRPCAQWTLNPAVRAEWGDKGLALAAANMEKIVAQSRDWGSKLTVVVYPWPDQVAAGDRDSVHIKYWREWSAKHGVRFIDAFPPFFREPAEATLEKYLIRGDNHFNAEGNKVLFDAVWPVISKDY